MNKQDKLDILKKRDSIKNMQIMGNGEAFIEILEAVVNELKDSLGVGVEFNNLDELIESLEQIHTLKEPVAELKKSISEIKIPEMPDNVKIEGLDSLIKAAEEIANKENIAKIDISTITPITDQVGNLIQAIEAIEVPKQGQEPSDYIPMRRVVLVGRKLMYDDSFYTGGGGGGGSTGGSVTQGTSPWVVSRDTSLLGNQQTSINSSTAETTIITADATYKLALYGLILTNTSGTVTKVTIKDATSGTTRMVLEVPATDTRGFMLPADSGHKQAIVNNNWTATCGTSVSTLEVTALFAKLL